MNTMFGRGDFEAVQDRWDGFWAGKNTNPIFSITVPKNGAECAPKPHWLAGFGGDYRAVADDLARWAESCEFYGDAIPIFPLSFGSDNFAAFCGANLTLARGGDTTWPSHPLKTLRGAKIAFDPNGKWWQRMVEYHDTLQRALGDSVLLCIQNLSGGLDGLVGLYGNTNLLMDMVDAPQAVHETMLQVNEAFTQAHEACARLFEYEKYGCATRLGQYARGAVGIPQCDTSCMISPEMFEEFAVPCLLHEIDALDAVIYHLDGPGAIRHLERLARIPKVRVVQWVAGAGEAATRDWTPLRRRILSLGKGLTLHGDAQQVAQMRRELQSNDIIFEVKGLKSRMQAEDFLAEMEQR